MKNLTTFFTLTLVLSASFISEAYADVRSTTARTVVDSENSMQENRRRTRVNRGSARQAPNRTARQSTRRTTRQTPNRTARQGSRSTTRQVPNRTVRQGSSRTTVRRTHPARRVVRQSNYRHSPYRHNYVPTRRYTRNSYQRYVRNLNHNYFYRSWVFYPTARINGYFVINGYPYYAYNGYQHRYSYQDYCDYQLVDSYSDSVYQYFDNQVCALAYDRCALERDRQNRYERDERFFCAEVFNTRY